MGKKYDLRIRGEAISVFAWLIRGSWVQFVGPHPGSLFHFTESGSKALIYGV